MTFIFTSVPCSIVAEVNINAMQQKILSEQGFESKSEYQVMSRPKRAPREPERQPKNIRPYDQRYTRVCKHTLDTPATKMSLRV